MSRIEQLKSSNQLAFNEIFQEYHAMIYNYILKRTTSKYYAEEVTQLVFIRLWKYRKGLSTEVDLDFQLLRIAKTTLIDYLRKAASNRRRQEKLNGQAFEPAQTEFFNPIELKEAHTKLKNLVNNLPPVRKQVFEMSRFNQLSNREISERLSITTKTVENHIYLALKFLKGYFT